MKILSCCAIAFLLNGCAAPYQPLASERASASYRKFDLNFGTGVGRTDRTTDSNTVSIYLRLFDSAGKLGMCAYYVTSPSFSSVAHDLFPSWLSGASFYLDETKIAPASFIPARQPRFDEYDAEAACIQTEVLFTAKIGSQRLRMDGPAARGLM